MALKICISQNKGGQAKSTTTICLADALRHIGKKVLVIDLDAQANTTRTYSAQYEDVCTVVDLLKDDAKVEECIQHTPMGDIIAGDPLLAQEEYSIFAMDGKEQLLNIAIESIEDEYDFIIIDTPPNLGVYTKIGMATADGVVIPIFAQKYAIDGLANLINQISKFRKVVNKNLKIFGVLQCCYNSTKSMDNEVRNQLPEFGKELGFNVFKTAIRQCQEIQKTQALLDENRSLYDHYPTSSGAIDYVEFVKELLQIIGG